MENDRFVELLTRRMKLTRETLATKGREYGRGDRLQNFKRAGRLGDVIPEVALQGMLLKHLVSIFDMIDDIDQGTVHPQSMWDEKLGDAINYLILLEALVVERIDIGQ